MNSSRIAIGAVLFVGSVVSTVCFQNCSGQSVDFAQSGSKTTAASVAVSPTATPAPVVPPQTFQNKNFSFYGTRVNGQLALVAQVSSPLTVSLNLSLSKYCGTLDDTGISGNGVPGTFTFTIPAGQTESAPLVLSAFGAGHITWSVNAALASSGTVVTNLIQTCSPWLSSDGATCDGVESQPLCIDNGG